MDVIELRGIRAYGKHGANPGERDRDQPFDVDVQIAIDLKAAAGSDDLADTIDYARLHAAVVRVIADRSYALLERLAADILEEIFADARVANAAVTIAKPHLLDGATPCVTLRRERDAQRR
ncbi:MAG TPA: dihydroneopterin aldolase [Candidatus Baltobacteraceae bacterium]|nr:dihydroneopterin aldolase [Candidatus Baltobacteraceae bacterium]